jgi:hypothetical protein
LNSLSKLGVISWSGDQGGIVVRVLIYGDWSRPWMAVNASALWLGRHCGPRVDIRRMEPRADGGECLRALIRAALGSACWYTANGAARGWRWMPARFD